MTALDTNVNFSDPLWLVWVKAVVVLVLVLVWIIMIIWMERKVLAKMMNRIGPQFNGPLGLFQTVAEGVKLIFKEDFQPGHVDKVIYNLAPIITAVTAFSVFAVVPFGGETNLFGLHTRLQLADGPVGILLVLAIASIGVYGVVLAGWASSDSFSLLGGLRASAQTLSYEVAMGLSLIPVFMWTQGMSTAKIVEAQNPPIVVGGFDTGIPGHYWLLLFPAFIIFFFAMFGEAGRAPFDLMECEQELVAGHQTEYSGFRFACYYLGEYIHMATAAALVTTVFLGGYRAPWPFNHIPGADTALWGLAGVVWFFIKANLVLFFMLWVRGSVPRIRYDQFMALGWKWLVPAGLITVVLFATIRLVQIQPQYKWYAIVLAAVFAVVALVWSLRPQAPEAVVGERPYAAVSGGYPVPPLPGQATPELPGRVVAHQAAPSSVVADAPVEHKQEG